MTFQRKNCKFLGEDFQKYIKKISGDDSPPDPTNVDHVHPHGDRVTDLPSWILWKTETNGQNDIILPEKRTLRPFNCWLKNGIFYLKMTICVSKMAIFVSKMTILKSLDLFYFNSIYNFWLGSLIFKIQFFTRRY